MQRYAFGLGLTMALCWAAPGSAMPRSDVAGAAVIQGAGVVCDDYGRCRETYRSPYGSRYGDRYGGYGEPRYRPPTKWERKGFCPPGQRKKGAC
ncbi:hypothetical protein [Alsobacter sp. SYSU BS001988]